LKNSHYPYTFFSSIFVFYNFGSLNEEMLKWQES